MFRVVCFYRVLRWSQLFQRVKVKESVLYVDNFIVIILTTLLLIPFGKM